MGGGDDKGRGEKDKKGKRERRQERKRMSRKLWKGVRRRGKGGNTRRWGERGGQRPLEW